MISILHTIRTFITDNTNQAHEIHTLGQFKDDQFQDHKHRLYGIQEHAGGGWTGYPSVAYKDTRVNLMSEMTNNSIAHNGRKGTTTHGKQIGISYIIKVL